MAKLTLADLTAEPTTIELFGGSYRVLALTRTAQKNLEKAQKVLDDLDDEDSDKAVATLAKVIETLLVAVDDAPPVGKAVADAWKRDELALGQIRALYEGVQEAAVARPTSRRQN